MAYGAFCFPAPHFCSRVHPEFHAIVGSRLALDAEPAAPEDGLNGAGVGGGEAVRGTA